MACLAPDGTVIDGKSTHRGPQEISAWKRAAQAKYSYHREVTVARAEGEGQIVACRGTGDLPGGEVGLRYRFILAGDTIARLEIAP